MLSHTQHAQRDKGKITTGQSIDNRLKSCILKPRLNERRAGVWRHADDFVLQRVLETVCFNRISPEFKTVLETAHLQSPQSPQKTFCCLSTSDDFNYKITVWVDIPADRQESDLYRRETERAELQSCPTNKIYCKEKSNLSCNRVKISRLIYNRI